MPDGAKHCTICGTPLEIPCGRCNKPMPNGIDFCPHCGSMTEKKKIEEREKEELKKDFTLGGVALVIAIVICVIFPIVSVPVGAAAYMIYKQMKGN